VNYSRDTIGTALCHDLISHDDAGLLYELLDDSADLSGTHEEYLRLNRVKREALYIMLRKNRYHEYQEGGIKPLTPSGRLDWRAKEEWGDILRKLDDLQHRVERIAPRFALRDGLVAKLGHLLTLASALHIVTNDIRRTKTSSARTLQQSISTRDIDLCLMWSGISNDGHSHTDVAAISALLGDSEASRLLSARAAELAAADYYTGLGHAVTDVSITQLENMDDSWKDFDLVVDGRLVDVKNARRSFSSPERYVEHCVPRFKQSRASKAEVSIAAVLSPYLAVGQIARSDIDYLMLGEVRVSDIRRIYVWMRNRFGHVLKLDGVWKPNYQPGWVFEYPPEHYPGRSIGVLAINDLLLGFDRAGVAADHIPGWLFALCRDQNFVASEHFSEDKQRILADLRSIDEQIGLTRPSIFLYVMGLILESIVNELPVERIKKPLSDLIFIRDPDSTRPSILGLDDPQGYVAELVETLCRVQEEVVAQHKQFISFELTHPSILRGRLLNGSWMTLLAYCGGWCSLPVKVKCGAAPLFFGKHEACPSCGYLICDECCYCSRNCKFVSSRQRNIAERLPDPVKR
jgi:hypothetical protein